MSTICYKAVALEINFAEFDPDSSLFIKKKKHNQYTSLTQY